MNCFNDFFTPTFLTFLGLLAIVLALIIIYFEGKMREQNHKISSMLSLVSSLAEELNNTKMGLNHLTMMIGGRGPTITRDNAHVLNMTNEDNNNLIHVSDDDNDDDDDDDDDNDDDDDDDDDDDEDDDSQKITICESNEIKILKLNIAKDESNESTANNYINDTIEEDDSDSEELDELKELEITSVSDSDSGKNFAPPKLNKSKQVANDFDFIKETSNEIKLQQTNNLFNLKSINISNLEELSAEPKGDKDYKKMSVTKLRDIVLEKGLSTDASKLKKLDLIKLLDLE